MKLTFGRKAVMALVSVSKMQLEYWDKREIVKPSKGARGKGTRREYSFKDLVALKTAKRLKDKGISLQKIRAALTWLRKHFPDLTQPFAELQFVTDGATIFVLDQDREKILDTLKRGQIVFFIALGGLIEKLRGEVKEFSRPMERRVAVGGQTFTVVLTPDLEDGGFAVQCREVPGAISQAESEQEAVDNITEVLEEHLEYVKNVEAGKSQAQENRRHGYAEFSGAAHS